MNQNTALQRYAKTLQQLENIELKDSCISGSIILDEEKLETLRALEADKLTTGTCEIINVGVSLGEKSLNAINDKFFVQGITAKIELRGVHITDDFAICDDWNALLSYERCVKNKLNEIFFTRSMIYLNPGSSNKRFINYQKIHKVYELVRQLIHEPETNSNTIYYERPLRIDFTLTENSLDSEIEIEALNNLLAKDLHKEAVKSLITKEVVQNLKDIELKKRFDHLIKNLNYIVSNVLLSYQSYVDNYSFDKVRREYHEKKTEYVKKINDVFDSTATKLLSVPAGLWFAISNIKSAEFGELGFIKNIIILISSAILTILLLLNIHGQFSTLKSLREDYTGTFDRLKEKFSEEQTEIEKLKTDLKSKDTQVCIKLWVSVAVAILLLIFTFIIMIKA